MLALVQMSRNRECKFKKRECERLEDHPGVPHCWTHSPLPISPFYPHPQVFDDPLIPEENMVTVVNDWVNLYINYYKPLVFGKQQEQDKALQELQQELNTLGSQFLTKYRTILKSRDPPNSKLPSS